MKASDADRSRPVRVVIRIAAAAALEAAAEAEATGVAAAAADINGHPAVMPGPGALHRCYEMRPPHEKILVWRAGHRSFGPYPQDDSFEVTSFVLLQTASNDAL